MTLASQIVTDGYREDNLIPLGTDPTSQELSDGLARLNGYVKSVYGHQLGENLIDWLVPAPQRTSPAAANYPQAPYPMGQDATVLNVPLASDFPYDVWTNPPKNSRIVWGGTNEHVYFHPQPDPGSRMAIVQGSGSGDSGMDGNTIILDGNGRLIDNDPTVTLTFDSATPVVQAWLYRDDLGKWITMKTLALTDDMPFPDEFDDMWITMLSIRLAPRYSKTPSDATVNTAKTMLVKLKARYRQEQVTVYGSDQFPRSLQSYISGRWYWGG